MTQERGFGVDRKSDNRRLELRHLSFFGFLTKRKESRVARGCDKVVFPGQGAHSVRTVG